MLLRLLRDLASRRRRARAEARQTLSPTAPARSNVPVRPVADGVSSQNVDTLKAQAVNCLHTGDHAAAERLLREARLNAPEDLDVVLLLGMVLERSGHAAEALALLSTVYVAESTVFELHLTFARAARAAGDMEAALTGYRAALACRPDNAELQAAFASACEALGRSDEAIAAYRRALALQPGLGDAQLNLGRLLLERGDLVGARTAFAASPGSGKAQHNLGLTLERMGDLAQAEHAYRQALALTPELEGARLNLAALLTRRGAHDEALRLLEGARAGQLARAHFNLAVTLSQLGRGEEAEVHVAAALSACAGDAGAEIDIGILLYMHGHAERAHPLLERAALANPTHAKAQWNLALSQLARGQLDAGWQAFETRFDPQVRAAIVRSYPFPRWAGEDLAGKALLVWGEQGVGDEITYAGMYPQLAQAGARVTLECKGKLIGLFSRSFPWAQVVERKVPPVAAVQSGFDYQTPAGSLARYLRRDLQSFPRQSGYLVADPVRVAHWREQVAGLGPGLKVGFCWRSSNLQGIRALACTSLDDWGALFRLPGIVWVSLQYDECAAELAAARQRHGVGLTRFDTVDYFDDLEEVSALMCALDLVVSAPTTVSLHAAALGIATWQMSYGVDWHQHGQTDYPWYPGLRYFRRRWDESREQHVAQLATQLERSMAAHDFRA